MELEKSIVYGPMRSRRFGWDLGINLLPIGEKLCAFDCVYCQYGFTGPFRNEHFAFPSAADIIPAWNQQLHRAQRNGIDITHTTISGNGEPTMHPHFERLIPDLVSWRDKTFPFIRIALLSTGYRSGDPKIRSAMQMVEEPIVKFDTGDPEKWLKLNRPLVPLSLSELIENLKTFQRVILQTMFVKGWNDSREDLTLWRKCLNDIRPSAVQIYTIQRTPADPSLIPVDNGFLSKVSVETAQILGMKIDYFTNEEERIFS